MDTLNTHLSFLQFFISGPSGISLEKWTIHKWVWDRSTNHVNPNTLCIFLWEESKEWMIVRGRNKMKTDEHNQHILSLLQTQEPLLSNHRLHRCKPQRGQQNHNNSVTIWGIVWWSQLVPRYLWIDGILLLVVFLNTRWG